MARFGMRRPTGLLALVGLMAVSAALIAAQAPAARPGANEGTAAQTVVRMLERRHISKPKVNDEIAKKWARNFLKTLDPQKYYFLKGDIDEFLKQDTTLDDKIHDGDITFAKDVFKVFLKRADERLIKAQAYITQAPDFTVEESIVDDPERLDWPATDDEANDRLRKYIKYDMLRSKIAKEDPEKSTKRLAGRYRDLARFWKQIDDTDLLERYLTSLATVIDPHSNYMGSKTLEDMMNQQLHLSLDGIGASLLTEDGYPVVKDVVQGAPADKDGRLQVEDKIIGIEDENGKEVDFAEKKLNDVVRVIRGKPGTKIRLRVQPDGKQEIVVYEITRGKVDLAESRAKGQVLETKDQAGKAHKVGVIHLGSFYGDQEAVMKGDLNAASTARDCKRIIDTFKKDGVEAIVLDLRGNGGGLLQEAVALSGLFIDTGPVVQIRDPRRTKPSHLDDDDAGTAWDGPLAVIIDHFSASASEIFAGVVKDYHRGLIVGDSSTYGKGTVQKIEPLNLEPGLRGPDVPNMGALKITVNQFYRPNGESTQIRGVAPDIHIASLKDAADFGEGKSESALKFDKVDPLPHEDYNKVPEALVDAIRERSTARIKASTKFQEQYEQIRKYVDRKAKHVISLNEAKFRAEVIGPEEEEDAVDKPKVAAKEAEKGKKPRRSDRPAWDSNYYNDEVIAIVDDYLELAAKSAAQGAAATAKPDAKVGMP